MCVDSHVPSHYFLATLPNLGHVSGCSDLMAALLFMQLFLCLEFCTFCVKLLHCINQLQLLTILNSLSDRFTRSLALLRGHVAEARSCVGMWRSHGGSSAGVATQAPGRHGHCSFEHVCARNDILLGLLAHLLWAGSLWHCGFWHEHQLWSQSCRMNDLIIIIILTPLSSNSQIPASCQAWINY